MGQLTMLFFFASLISSSWSRLSRLTKSEDTLSPVRNYTLLRRLYGPLDGEQLREVFGVRDKEIIPDHVLIIPEANVDRSKKLHSVRLRGLSGRINLRVRTTAKHSVFTPDVLVVNRHYNYTSVEIGSKRTSCAHYAVEEADIYGLLSLCDHQWRGTLVVNGDLYTLLPLPEGQVTLDDILTNHGRPAGDSKPHVLYKRSAFMPDSPSFCGVDTSFERTMMDDPMKIRKVPGAGALQNPVVMHPEKLVMELAIFVDNELWLKYSRKYGAAADEKLTDFMNTVIHHVQILYQDPSISPQLEFSVVRFEVFKLQPKALKGPKHDHGNALSYLNAFCKYQFYLGGKRRWDFALLFSGYDIHRPPSDRTISGIARLYGVCDPLNSCLLAEGTDFSSVYITTHEIGHGLGMLHDEPYCPSSYIMSGSLGAGKVHWSRCSNRSFQTYLKKLNYHRKNCLNSAQFPPGPVNTTLLPGQKYSADEQCQMVHGTDYNRVKTSERVNEGICHMLWCGQNNWGRIITSHPALEGTSCAVGKYCRGGKCVPDRSRNPPKVVNGAWSSWKQVSCSSCSCPPIMSSLGILKSERTCTNPAPENGGADCSGSSHRAIVCSRHCAKPPIAEVVSAKAYTNRICAGHRQRLNDAAINGIGVQLTRFSSRACKVFCEINVTNADSINFRFFGDWMPDGSPCGDNHYCISGRCLPLDCRGSALVLSPTDCPTESESCQLEPKKPVERIPTISNSIVDNSSDKDTSSYEDKAAQPGETRDKVTDLPSNDILPSWSPWSAWSDCSASCGEGVKTRGRTCWRGHCDGEAIDQDSCRLQPCIEARSIDLKDPLWSSWGEWTPCSTTCGTGARARYRKCIIGNCPGSYNEVQQCEMPACGHWMTWSAWSECSATCGVGVRRRSRVCDGSRCPGEHEQSFMCHEKACDFGAEWSSWSAWSSCSVSCGMGERQRRRTCRGNKCSGIATMSEQCKLAECAAWASWGLWSGCSRSTGLRVRNRQCYGLGSCTGHSTESEHCSAFVNPNGWTEWSAWSECSRTCGVGFRRRYRTCLGTREMCPGDFKTFETCHLRECPQEEHFQNIGPLIIGNGWPQNTGNEYGWSQWSHCVGRCGTGIRKRLRLCRGPSCPASVLSESQYCQLPPCG
uniref:Peptidase M12B domain-containing protein n=1 Tax=Trichuris muris TaxID=70415 RepID=A0A5S6QYL3_TRIMR